MQHEMFSEYDDEFEEPEFTTLTWNDDPEWIKYTAGYEPVIKQIANKYTTDEHLREECEQEARMRLLTKFPYQCRAYPLYKEGTITEAQFQKALNVYLRQCIRNAILDYLNKWVTGNWYIGRTRRKFNKITGKHEKVHVSVRYASLDDLMDNHGMDINEDGEITWPEVSHDGLWEHGWGHHNG
jgi:hypothetical protein